MTDSEKLDLILYKLQEHEEVFSKIENRMQRHEEVFNNIENNIQELKCQQMKSTAELKAMDKIILDEVKRVHMILDKHKNDSSKHIA